MAKRRKKGPSYTAKAEDRHWFGNRQAARAAKSAGKGRPGTGSDGRTGSGAGRAGAAGRTGAGRTGSARTGRPEVAAVRKTARTGEVPEVVAGRNPVVEALRARVPASALYVAADASGRRVDSDDRVNEAIKLATTAGIPLLEVGKPELDRLTERAVHQGIALKVRPYDYAHPEDLLARAGGEPPLIVALDGVTDPRNLGAVIRSAAAFGAHGVLVPERRAAGVTAGAWKASAGTLATVPVARATNLTRALKAYKDAGCFVAGLDASGAVGVDALEVAADPLVLVAGSEGRGLSRLVAESCDMLVRIPMGSRAESLNAGVAAGIALYEIARRRSS